MARFVLIETDDSFGGFFDNDIHSAVPEGAVAISDDVYARWLDAGHDAYRVDGAGQLVAYTPPPEPPQPRRTDGSTLLDALSKAQRAAISADNMARLAMRSTRGLIPETDLKVVRAAADMGLSPKTWFDLALPPSSG